MLIHVYTEICYTADLIDAFIRTK